MLIVCRIQVDQDTIDSLSPSDRLRLSHHIALSEQIGKKSAENMIKGILKYPDEEDEKSMEYWIEHGIDDSIDTVNYQYLLKDLHESQEPKERYPSGVTKEDFDRQADAEQQYGGS